MTPDDMKLLAAMFSILVTIFIGGIKLIAIIRAEVAPLRADLKDHQNKSEESRGRLYQHVDSKLTEIDRRLREERQEAQNRFATQDSLNAAQRGIDRIATGVGGSVDRVAASMEQMARGVSEIARSMAERKD